MGAQYAEELNGRGLPDGLLQVRGYDEIQRIVTGQDMSFDEASIQQVWEKGRLMADRDWNHWRRDECGAWMYREHYGNESSEFGWKIVNVSTGGNDSIEHLRPLHHGNHFEQATGQAHCKVTADLEGVQPTAHISAPRNRAA